MADVTKSAIIGIVTGLLFGIINVFGLLCLCCPGVGFSIVAGYVVAMLAGIKKDDYGGLAMNMGVFAVLASVISMILSSVLAMLNIGATAVFGSDAASTFISAGIGVIGLVMQFIAVFMILFIGGVIGGAVYMFTKK